MSQRRTRDGRAACPPAEQCNEVADELHHDKSSKWREYLADYIEAMSDERRSGEPAPQIWSTHPIRRAWLLALCLVAAAPATAASAATPKRSCATRGKTLDASSYARLYRHQDVVYACLRDGRRRLIGAQEEDGTGEYIFRLSGRYVATDALTCVRGLDGTASLEVRDLQSGRVVRAAQVDDDANVIRDLVLTTKGDVAWIRSNGTVRHVLKLDAPGPPVVLDAGNDIALSSLARAGTTLYWTPADGPRTGQLGTPARTSGSSAPGHGEPPGHARAGFLTNRPRARGSS